MMTHGANQFLRVKAKRATPNACQGSLKAEYLEGQGDLVSRLITLITHIVTLIIPVITLLTKSPWPSK